MQIRYQNIFRFFSADFEKFPYPYQSPPNQCATTHIQRRPGFDQNFQGSPSKKLNIFMAKYRKLFSITRTYKYIILRVFEMI